MAGKTGYTPTPAAFDPQVHMDAIYAHFDPLVDPSVPNVAALPAASSWVGRHIWVIAEGNFRTSDGSTWLRPNPMNQQLDTTNSVIRTITQIGSGKILGTGGATVSEVVTFPVAFASVPRVIVTSQGGRTPGTFNDAGLPIGAIFGVASGKSATGFSAGLVAPGGSVPSATDWYYDWIAIGVPA